ncbi:carboxymuconolactone decarboxylase family protein [Mucilaginibacter sabulilitoris]|uniref:Carboxymuconolactone decarboxylase family protein n=1 Tax=Mucilaginibacter sabulilitoris TaxID=1173583 RepID=A0ABZ0TV08_9SPHI|nr:carboxymuconolactone decarboxylase family protein [Mucilaginibacter sabulilitoris]WPU96917.1 carboxymuconolactone decarboxylase family protein [Mucilaginibacter sabulilitoris]
MSNFLMPNEQEVSDKNKKIFEEFKRMFGKVPNIFLAFTSSENGLESYFNYFTQKNSLSYREREVINLVVSQVNECPYCLSLHSVIAERLGFTKEQILDIRANNILFDNKLKAIAALAQRLVVAKGNIAGPYLLDFYQQGYDQGHLVDVVLAVGNISTLNLLYAISNVPIDFPHVTVKL